MKKNVIRTTIANRAIMKSNLKLSNRNNVTLSNALTLRNMGHPVFYSRLAMAWGHGERIVIASII